MSGSILLDTHIALWLDSGSERLHPRLRTLIDTCWRNGGSILLSAVSAWEIALLVDTGRISLDVSVEAWIDRFSGRPGVRSIPLSPHAAARAYRLYHLEHRDPGDRLLIATSIELACPLATCDARIEHFARAHGAQYGFTTCA